MAARQVVARSAGQARRSDRRTSSVATSAAVPLTSRVAAAALPGHGPSSPAVCAERRACRDCEDSTDPELWWDSSDRSLWFEATDRKDIAEPTEKAEAKEPTLPTERNDPALPTESTDPSDHADRIELRDWKDHMRPA